MDLLSDLARWNLLAFGLVLLVTQMAAHELGFWMGRRHASRDPGEREGTGVVVGGMLGLLAFVLALTLSFASSRFDERRTGTLAEANAIGTAWLRASAIAHARGAPMAAALVEYAHVRKAFVESEAEGQPLDALNQRSNALQGLIWGHLTAIVQERTDAVANGLASALTEAFDAGTAERFAFAQRVPPQLVRLLFGSALLAIGALGYQLGLRGRPVRVIALLLMAMWTLVMVDILDLGAARIGRFRTTVAAYDWTIQGLSGVTVPPLSPR